MRHFILIFISLFLLTSSEVSANAQSVQKKYIRYTEKLGKTNLSYTNQGLPLKSERLSNKEGDIILIYDDSLNDSIKIAIEATKKLWASKIQTSQPIFISILFEELESDVSMISEVSYCESSDFIGCPCSLASQFSGFPYGSYDSPDGYIILNSNLDWNCTFSNELTLENNIPTILLRGIARCLGFGSSVVERISNNFYYDWGWPTYFDKLLYDEKNNAMQNLREGSLEMAQFITSDSVFANTETQMYSIYAPSKFVQGLSLCYFKDPNSIMSYSLGKGNINLRIDDKTTDILKTIGWNIPTSAFNIGCNNISNNGIGSSYESHTFSLIKGNENVSNYHWKFFLKNKQGKYIQISETKSEEFTISKITSPDNYYININGDLEGRIECDYIHNGSQYSAPPFSLSLELKPSIISISEISMEKVGQYNFNLKFNVQYSGADYVSVEIEEEYNTTLRNYRFDEPYLAHIKTGKITNLYYSWITIIVSNKYGTTYETLEYPPIYVAKKNTNNHHLTTINNLGATNITKIRVYDLEGSIIFEGDFNEFINYNFNQGIYIKNVIFDDGTSKTDKIIF